MVETLRSFEPESIDCVVTDPPYGIGFMGKAWDKALPPKEAFQEIFRVLKSGALAFVMSSPRQDVLWRMLKMLEECGFQLKQSFISHIYKTGFPKAMDISLAIDKKFIREEFVANHGRKPTKDEMKALLKEKRKVVTERYKTIHDKGSSYQWSQTKNETGYCPITEPYHDLAKKWEGWKSITGLKPALECILMVNKPLSEKTIVDNVLKHGVGAINVDACRIPFQNEAEFEDLKKNDFSSLKIREKDSRVYDGGTNTQRLYNPNQKGRFPANLLVSDGALDTGKITKTGDLKPHYNLSKDENGNRTANIYGKFKRTDENYIGDVGDQSRYFDLDAWARHHGFLDVAKASKRERNFGLEKSKISSKIANPNYGKGGFKRPTRQPDRKIAKAKNFHPTVKPVKLMAYLIELGCPPDGVVLDPFCGSGTTLIAAHRLNRKWIGIEINPEYAEITKHRLSVLNQKLTEFYR